MQTDIIEKLKQVELTGKSGSNFPTHLKWQAVKNAISASKYVICNASEGEPGMNKDKYILENFLNDVILGIKLAMDTVGAKTGYIYINPEYYDIFKNKLIEAIGNLPIELFKKPKLYIAGEETTLLNVIEGKAIEPRIKPPFPSEKGLFGKPTLINNVETLYWAYKISQDQFRGEQFYSITGDCPNPGVFLLKENIHIDDALEQTHNIPFFDFFVKAGGKISGEIVLQDDLAKPIKGLASVTIYKQSLFSDENNKDKTNILDLMKQWASFYNNNNCDRCTPCREGIYRIKEMLNKEPINKQALFDILFALEKTSLCPFGKMSANAFKTALTKLL